MLWPVIAHRIFISVFLTVDFIFAVSALVSAVYVIMALMQVFVYSNFGVDGYIFVVPFHISSRFRCHCDFVAWVYVLYWVFLS